MKRYTSVFDLEKELVEKGYVKNKNVTIPANGDPDETFVNDREGNNLHYYPKFKAYFIHTSHPNFKEMPTYGDFTKPVIDTWKEWRINFDESTSEKKKLNADQLNAHFKACDDAGLNREMVGLVLFKIKF